MTTVHFPKSAMTASTQELTDVVMNVTEGALPADLQGYVFVIGTVGDVNSNGLPRTPPTSILNGDGMLYRFHFDGAQCRVTNRIAKTACYYADLATKPGTLYDKYRFRNLGMARVSLALGNRNFANTALLPMKQAADPARLFLTYDAGRPYEVDLDSLKTVTPVGATLEWRPQILGTFPFPPMMTGAHPYFDAHTGEMFLPNYGKSSGTILSTIPAVFESEKLPPYVEALLEQFAALAVMPVGQGSPSGRTLLQTISNLLANIFQPTWMVDPQDFCYLIRWNGAGKLERWRLVLPDGSPVTIKGSTHQIGVTKDYIVVADTAFKFGLSQITSEVPASASLERLIRFATTSPQPPQTPLYIIARSALTAGQIVADGEPEVIVVARPAILPLETVHYLVDYDNPNHEITLHASHNCATDAAEWLRRSDVSMYTQDPVAPEVTGMLSAMASMDVNRMGRYKIKADTGQILESVVVSLETCTWGMAFYAARDVPAWDKPPAKIDHIYWCSAGFWPEIASRFLFDLYRDYPHRHETLDRIRSMPETDGLPACIFRLDTATMDCADIYVFQNHELPSSPQFVPNLNPTPEPTEGYLFSTVFTDAAAEVWIFDAASLHTGPICKLSSPALSFAFSLHSAYLPSVDPRTASYFVPAQSDYADFVSDKPELEQLFQNAVYPWFTMP